MIAEILPKVAGLIAEDESEHKYYPRPSLADPERCTRQMDYNCQGYKRTKMAGRVHLVLDDSSWHEELVADWIRKTAYRLHSEQMQIESHGLKGKIDGIITDLLGNDRLWEQKAINHFTFERYWGGKLPVGYLTQCSFYLDGLQKVNPDIHEAVLLIKNKNNSIFIEFLLLYTPDILTVKTCTRSTGEIKDINQTFTDILTNAMKRFAEIQQYANEKKLHDRPYMLGEDWQCDELYCGWSKLCWSTYEQEFSELKTDVELPSDIADTVRFYKELGAQQKEIETQREELKDKIKAVMKEQKAQTGRAGEYLLKLKLSEVERIDETLLSSTELERCTKKSFSERLYISNMNKKEKK